MGSAEKFCLRWNDFESNISVAFRELRDDKDFFDVTLACDDNQLPAHKVILSACSPFFRNILRKNPHQHPLLYLKGVKYKELQSVLNFMYMGEVNVAQEELNSFLSVAEDLRVKGLTQNNSDSSNSSSSNNTKTEQKHSSHIPAARIREPPEREHIPPAKKHRPAPHHHVSVPDLPPADDDIQEVVPVKSEPRDTLTVPAPSEANYHHDSTEAEGGTVAIQDSYAEDSYNYGGGEGYEDQGGYDDGAYEQTLQTVNADGNKGVSTCTAEKGKRNEVLIKEEEVDLVPEQLPDSGEDDDGETCRWDIEIESRISLDLNLFICMACLGSKYSSMKKLNVISHVVSKHVHGFAGFICELCPQVFNSRKRFERHMKVSHNVLTVSAVDVVKSEESITD